MKSGGGARDTECAGLCGGATGAFPAGPPEPAWVFVQDSKTATAIAIRTKFQEQKNCPLNNNVGGNTRNF